MWGILQAAAFWETGGIKTLETLKVGSMKHFLLLFLVLKIRSGTCPSLMKFYYQGVCYYFNKNWHQKVQLTPKRRLRNIQNYWEHLSCWPFLLDQNVSSLHLHYTPLWIGIFIKHNKSEFFKGCNHSPIKFPSSNRRLRTMKIGTCGHGYEFHIPKLHSSVLHQARRCSLPSLPVGNPKQQHQAFQTTCGRENYPGQEARAQKKRFH